MRLTVLAPIMGILFLFPGCDSTTRFKVLSTVFDGVPRLPEREEYCAEFAAERVAAVLENRAVRDRTDMENQRGNRSEHLPYTEKRCNDCHDKDKPDGLIEPAKELCTLCHPRYNQGKFVHGPVAVGDCLACHLPHTASFPALLKAGRGEICQICHQEQRLAAQMHEKVAAKDLECVDCHDPHIGNIQYFLK